MSLVWALMGGRPTARPAVATYAMPQSIQAAAMADQIPYLQLAGAQPQLGRCPSLLGSEPTLGCYDYGTHRITIDPSTAGDSLASGKSMQQVLAYEYLHYWWNAGDNEISRRDNENAHYEAELMNVYNTNPDLQQAMVPVVTQEHFKVGSRYFYDELHATVGTYMDYAKLPHDLQAHYLQVVPGLNNFPSFY